MKKQRFLLILMTIMLAVAIMPTSVFAWSGAGTEASPYLVSNAADMAQVRNYPEAHFKLTANITLTSAWTPIGDENKPFEGVFNGNGYTISGLTITASGSDVYAGLFGYSKGEIKNLVVNFSEINVTAKENAYVGGIVAFNNRGAVANSYAEGTITVNAATTLNTSNVYVGMIAGRSTGEIVTARAFGSISAAVSATTATRTTSNPLQVYAGGIVGLIDKTLKNCSAVVDITATSNSSTKYSSAEVKAGGLAGESSDIKNSFAAGVIYAETASTLTQALTYAGGLVGKSTGNITKTSAIGDVTSIANASGAATYAGGLIGYNTGSVNNSYSNGNATAQTTSTSDAVYAGGLIGINGGTVSGCYAAGVARSATAGTSMTGGLVGYTSQAVQNSYFKNNESYLLKDGCGTAKTADELKLSATYSNWDYTNTWSISSSVNNGYPTLKFMSAPDITFVSAEHTYDGTEKTITATNVGSGVVVIYKNNKATDAGVYSATAIEKKADHTFAVASAEFKINKKPVSAANIVVLNKDYDGTKTAVLDTSAATISGIVSNDAVTLDSSKATATFETSEPGENIKVTVSGLALTGNDAGNYELMPYTTTGKILEGYDSVVFEGSGTKADPYMISTELELNAIRVNSDKHFKLKNDIALERNFRPIETFSGTFDGDGHTISGLEIKCENKENVGLFGKNTGTITNVIISANSFDIISVDMANIGIVAGLNEGTIINVKVLGTLATDTNGSFVYVGGITGKNTGTVSKSISEANITGSGTNVYAGGAIGGNSGSVEKTYSTGNVTICDALTAYAGGFTGISTNAISDSYSTGNANVSVTDVCFMINVGGFAGRVDGGTINQSYSIGVPTITVTESGNTLETAIGGFVAVNNSVINNCYYNTETSAQSDTGKGEPKTTAQLKDRKTYSAWNFTDWKIADDTNNGYPVIRIEKEEYDAKISYNNGTVTIDAYANINNAYLIIASYYNGLIVDYDLIENVTVESGKLGEKTVKSNFIVKSGGAVKVMLWKDLKNIQPLAKFDSIGIQ